MSQKVRLKDVAERAGVAVNTASTILNRRPNSWASKETEARVFAAAKELGYRPSKTARALQSGRYHSIGLLIQDLTNPFFSTIADELESAVEAKNYDLIIENCRSSVIREKRMMTDIRDLEVDGTVVWLSDNEVFRDDLAACFQANFPIVALGNGVPEPALPVDAVLSDFTEGLTQAIASLCELGHRRFAFLSALADGQHAGSRPELFQSLLGVHGIPESNIHILRCGHSIESARESFANFLGERRSDRPTALVAMNDLAAIGSMRAAREAGLEVPKDLSVVGVDDVPICSYLPLTLSSIRQRYRMITQNAAQLLLERIEGEATAEPRQVVVPTLFVPRESIGPAPNA